MMLPSRAYFALAAVAAVAGCSSGKAPPPTQSNTIETPFQINTLYALEQTDDGEVTARARFYDVLQAFDWSGNAGTIALSPGDTAWADGKPLDVETRTEIAGALRVDYSQKIPKGKALSVFELRRPNETITASIPAPEPLTVTVTDHGITGVSIAWTPVVKDAKVLVLLKTTSQGCALFSESGLTPTSIPDAGAYEWRNADQFRSNDTRQCSYVVTVERRVQGTRSATWKKGTNPEVPTNGVHYETVRRGTKAFDLPKL